MMVCLPTHICVIRPQWVKLNQRKWRKYWGLWFKIYLSNTFFFNHSLLCCWQWIWRWVHQCSYLDVSIGLHVGLCGFPWLVLPEDFPTGFLPNTYNCGLRMRRECRECLPRHRGLAIPTCITTRAVRAVMYAGIANQRFPLKSVAGKAFPAFPAHAPSTILRIW